MLGHNSAGRLFDVIWDCSHSPCFSSLASALAPVQPHSDWVRELVCLKTHNFIPVVLAFIQLSSLLTSLLALDA